MIKGKDERVELIRAFIKEMLSLGYAEWYIGKQTALLIRAWETRGKE